MTEKELRKLKKTELLELMIALRNELDRLQAENEMLRQKLQTAENNALQQVETEAVLAVRKLLQAVETETDAYRKRIQKEQDVVVSKPAAEETKEQ
ncbi:MAG: DNA repair protein [Oscillospiraceae bacterium]|nr:DNA repair protein [Oscillospiraceae bacterium]MDD7295601.1 DNA repair protein [Oscillospiraceae bacterium]MDY2509538.1 DNA repair protein [Ruminococcus callidus]